MSSIMGAGVVGALVDRHRDRLLAFDAAGSAPPRKERRRIARRGVINRRILFSITKGGRERQLHATKGWRSYRA